MDEDEIVEIAGDTFTPLEFSWNGQVFLPDQNGIFRVPAVAVPDLRSSYLYPLAEALQRRRRHAEAKARAELSELDAAIERLDGLIEQIFELKNTASSLQESLSDVCKAIEALRR